MIFDLFPSISICYRHTLAAVHFNCNLNRDIKKNEDGTEQLHIVYPKFKNGEATVRNIKVPQNFGKMLLILSKTANKYQFDLSNLFIFNYSLLSEYVEDIYQTFLMASKEKKAVRC